MRGLPINNWKMILIIIAELNDRVKKKILGSGGGKYNPPVCAFIRVTCCKTRGTRSLVGE